MSTYLLILCVVAALPAGAVAPRHGPATPLHGVGLSDTSRIVLAQADLPTLEDAVFLESRVDKNKVYLGERVNLTLTFGQLRYRGIRVQNLYKTRQMRPPDTEGFFSGALVENTRELTRDGQTYDVTEYHIPLFPTRAGDLIIGAWRWQGTVRGHTGGGARVIPIDSSTEPLTVTVRPLPPAPSDFGGAVGAFTVSTRIDSQDLVQGVPTTVHVEIQGVGNFQALRTPTMPPAPWYRLGEALQQETAMPSESGEQFSRRFSYELMPLQGGSYALGPVKFTFFSPEAGDYVTLIAPALGLEIKAATGEEALVVLGGALHNAESAGLVVMDDGRLPLATRSEGMGRPVSLHALALLLGFLPMAFFGLCYGIAELRGRGRAQRAALPMEARLRGGLRPEGGIDGLRGGIVREIRRATGCQATGMTAAEGEAALRAAGLEEGAAELGWALEACERYRYSGAEPVAKDIDAIIQRAAIALEACEGQRREA